MERIAMVARLKPDVMDRARELAAVEPRAPAGISHISIFVSRDEVVFLLEGAAPDQGHQRFLDDPVSSTLLAPWLPLFDGPLHRAPEIASWDLG